MKKLLAAFLILLCATYAHAQNAITLPYAAQVAADIGNGPVKVRVTQGNASIFTSQGSGVGSTSGSSTLLTLTTTPATPPIVGGLISGTGITSGTTVTAYNGTTGVTLSAAMTVPVSTAIAWGALCPSSAAGIPSRFIQASVSADYYLLYTQARVCAVSPGGPSNTLLILPIFYDGTTPGGGGGSSGVTAWNGRTGTVIPITNDYNFNQLAGSIACSQYAALTGDITSSAGSCGTTLATVNANVGTFGSSTQCVTATANAKGLITAISAGTCTPVFSSLTGTISVAQVGSSGASHAVPVDVGGTIIWKVVPNCLDTAGQHINYTQSTDTWSCGSSGAGNLPGQVLVTSIGTGTYTAYAPDGTTICTTSTTKCFQEGITYATTNRFNFKANCAENNTFLGFTAPLSFGPGTSILYDLTGCSVAFSGFTGDSIKLDTLDQGSHLKWTGGYITSTATGGSAVITFNPHTAAPSSGTAFQGSRVDFPYVLAGAAVSRGVVFFEAVTSTFSIANGNAFTFSLIDGNAGGFFAPTCISVENTPNANNAFVQNIIDFTSCQNVATTGIKIGTTAPTGPIGTNIWKGMIGVGTTQTFGIETFGQLDQFYLSSVSVNAGSLNTGIIFRAGANHNYIIAPQMEGTTAVNDSGTGNCGVINDKQKACPGGSW